MSELRYVEYEKLVLKFSNKNTSAESLVEQLGDSADNFKESLEELMKLQLILSDERNKNKHLLAQNAELITSHATLQNLREFYKSECDKIQVDAKKAKIDKENMIRNAFDTIEEIIKCHQELPQLYEPTHLLKERANMEEERSLKLKNIDNFEKELDELRLKSLENLQIPDLKGISDGVEVAGDLESNVKELQELRDCIRSYKNIQDKVQNAKTN